MTAEQTACPRCGAALEEGFLLDHHRVTSHQARWIEGAPQEGLFGVRLGDRKQYRVRADRCTACGHLELRAIQRQY
jgi:hypothetical protein